MLAKKVARLRKRHLEALLGREATALDARSDLWCTLDWFCGFIQSLEMQWFRLSTYEAIVAAPAARAPLHLWIKGGLEDVSLPVASRPPPGGMLSATFGSDATSTRRLERLTEVLPRNRLAAHCDSFQLRELTSPTLRSLHLVEQAMPAAVLEQVFEATLPSLEELVLDLRWVTSDVDAVVAFDNFAKSDRLPSLRRLALRGSADPALFLRSILDSPLASRLSDIDLSTDLGAQDFEGDDDRAGLLVRLGELVANASESALSGMRIHFIKTFGLRWASTLHGIHRVFSTRDSFVQELGV